MQCFDNGMLFTVTVLAREVEEFARAWPCSGLNRNKPVTFQFDKHSGDLVDSNDGTNYPDADGAAIVALCDDAKHYGESRLERLVAREPVPFGLCWGLVNKWAK